jgi:hypothetical protein
MHRDFFGPADHRWGPEPSWGHHVPHIIVQSAPAAPSDTWLNIVLGLAALAGVLTFVLALFAAYRYSRKANVAVSATGHRIEGGAVIAVRPSVTAIGPFKFRFSQLEGEGAWIDVFDRIATSDGKTDYGALEMRERAYDQDEQGEDQFANPGETMTNTVIFRVPTDTPELVGWVATLGVDAKGWRRGMHWRDRFFVPLPPPLPD